ARRSLLREGGVHDIDIVAARFVEPDGVLDELGEMIELVLRKRRLGGLAVLAYCTQVVYEHRDREPPQPARRLARVIQGPVDLEILGLALRGAVRASCAGAGDRARGSRCGGRTGLSRCGSGRLGSRCRWRAAAARGQRDSAGGRLIAERARHALRARAIAAGLLGALLAANDLTVGL